MGDSENLVENNNTAYVVWLKIQQLFSEDPHLASVKLAAIKKDMQVLSIYLL